MIFDNILYIFNTNTMYINVTYVTLIFVMLILYNISRYNKYECKRELYLDQYYVNSTKI